MTNETKGGVYSFTHPSGTTCVILVDEPKFDPGGLASSAGADSTLDFADTCLAVGHHIAGDWGRASPGLRARNERALSEGDLLVSTHRDRRGNDFAIITLPQRTETWVVLVEECKRLSREHAEGQVN